MTPCRPNKRNEQFLLPCHDAATCTNCCEGLVGGKHFSDFCQLRLNRPAVTTAQGMTPGPHSSICVDGCKGTTGAVDGFHIYQLLLINCCRKTAARPNCHFLCFSIATVICKWASIVAVLVVAAAQVTAACAASSVISFPVLLVLALVTNACFAQRIFVDSYSWEEKSSSITEMAAVLASAAVVAPGSSSFRKHPRASLHARARQHLELKP